MTRTPRRGRTAVPSLALAWLVAALVASGWVLAPVARAVDPSPSPGAGAAPGATPVPIVVGVTPTRTRPPATPSPAPSSTSTPSPSPSSSLPAGVTPLPASVTFYGRGYGHGVGLSQYGARGRALAGQDAATIVAHYYAGTALGPMDPATPIRVLVLSGWTATASAPLIAYGRWGSWTIDGIAKTFPADAQLTMTPTLTTTSAGATATWRLRVVSAAGVVLHEASTGSIRLRPAETATRLELWSKPSAWDTYRGTLTIRPSSTAATVSATNELAIDDYLRGVVPAEMPYGWPTAALSAQALAARSYAAYRLRPGTSTYDVYDDTRSQVYRGVLGERATTDAVIAAAPGAILTSGGAVANALFHSTGGGATEHNENVFVSATGAKVAGPVSYLRGSSDRAADGTSYDTGAPYATWKTNAYTVAQLSSWFGADSRTSVGTLLGLDLRSRGVSGRLIKVVLYGTNGTKTVSGDVFRSVFNTRSPSADPGMMSTLFALQPIP